VTSVSTFSLDHCLPKHLLERVRVIGKAPIDSSKDFVLYWMRTAARVDENPALDTARWIAHELGLPFFIYHALSERYEYASDRHHTFILEGARDVQVQADERGLPYAFHLERSGSDRRYLSKLAASAACVVTEDMPVPPASNFLRALRWSTTSAILAVDTACVVPMKLVGKAHTRAYEYRDATSGLYQSRLRKPWPDVDLPIRFFDVESLPFPSIDLTSADPVQLVAQCDIDHSIGPVLDTQGGSIAGYRRWERFRDEKLRKYARLRNDPPADGSSRMSAYLHYGMVSPMRIAREASESNSESADKYLDELLIWRELAYAFCFHREDCHRWSAIPDWAQATLYKHVIDRRSNVYSWEQLARGKTDDELWNAAQKSLLIHGELHNNVRMTWGKALLEWTSSPREALRNMIDLNHRYALDGRDPASYGGILWCLGQFDRPFFPEQPIFGTVRTRPLSVHAQRLDVAKYSESVAHSRSSMPPSIVVIGAGVSGAMAARTLADHGLRVTVFDKSRGVAGRMSLRRTETAEFDHGAQYFTARHPDFRRYVKSWVEQGVVAPWVGKIVSYDRAANNAAMPGTIPIFDMKETSPIERFVGTPAMTSLAKHILRDVDVLAETRIEKILKNHDQFELFSDQGRSFGTFDRAIVALPAPQAGALLTEFGELAAILGKVSYDPCWCVMAEFDKRLELPWVGAFVNGGPLRWMARNQTKPGRCRTGECLVLHADPVWSTEHLDDASEAVSEELISVFWQAVGLDRQVPRNSIAHRWRYSIPRTPTSERCLAEADSRLIACGDWAGGPKVEGAFLSGVAAAGRILATLPVKIQRKRQVKLFE
jgi:photolyase PhrII